MGCLLAQLMVRQELFEVSGQQLLLHGEPHPRPGPAHIGLDLAHVLDVPARQGGRGGGNSAQMGVEVQREDPAHLPHRVLGLESGSGLVRVLLSLWRPQNLS